MRIILRVGTGQHDQAGVVRSTQPGSQDSFGRGVTASAHIRVTDRVDHKNVLDATDGASAVLVLKLEENSNAAKLQPPKVVTVRPLQNSVSGGRVANTAIRGRPIRQLALGTVGRGRWRGDRRTVVDAGRHPGVDLVRGQSIVEEVGVEHALVASTVVVGRSRHVRAPSTKVCCCRRRPPAPRHST